MAHHQVLGILLLLVIKGLVTFLGLGVVPQAKPCSGTTHPSSNDKTCMSVFWPSVGQLSDVSVHEDDSANTMASSNSSPHIHSVIIIAVHSFTLMATPWVVSS